MSAGYQCVPDPHAASRTLPGEEGRQAGHQSHIHCQPHPGGLQDTTGQLAGPSWEWIQDCHGIYTKDALTWSVIFQLYFKIMGSATRPV